MRTRVTIPLVVVIGFAFSASLSALGGGGGGPPPDPAIAYADGGLRVMNADGSNSRLVVAIKGSDWVRYPTWSPDNSQLAFCGNLKGNEGIWVVNLDGSGLRFVTPHVPFVASKSDWSTVATPDGQHKIAFSQRDPATGDQDLFVVNLDGSGLQNLTASPAQYEFEGCWTRDGSGLYVTRDQELVRLDLAALSGGGLEISSETSLASDFVGICFPASANHSDLVAYSGMGASLGPMYVFLLDAAAPSSPVRLTSGAGDERWASFSPDDSQLAFHRNGRSTGGVFTIRVDGSGEKRIAKSGSDPAWKRG